MQSVPVRASESESRTEEHYCEIANPATKELQVRFMQNVPVRASESESRTEERDCKENADGIEPAGKENNYGKESRRLD